MSRSAPRFATLLALVASAMLASSGHAEPGPAPAATSAPDAPAAPRATRRYVVAAIGDSLTDERNGGGRYLEHLRARCPRSRFDGFGKGGEMVNQMRARFDRDVLGAGADGDGAARERYTHVIVFGGVNDLYSDLSAGRTPAKVQADLAAMYSAARARGAAVVAITVAPWAGFKRWYTPRRGVATLQVNRWIEEQRAGGAVDHVLDAYSLLSSCGPTMPASTTAAGARLCKAFGKKDGIHLSAAGYERLGDALHRGVFSDCD